MLIDKNAIRRAAHLIALAHHNLNHPVQAGPVWAKYPRPEIKTALDALYEAHLLLEGRPVEQPEQVNGEAAA